MMNNYTDILPIIINTIDNLGLVGPVAPKYEKQIIKTIVNKGLRLYWLTN